MAATQSGKPGKSVIGIYNTGSATSLASSSYKGLVFVGYNGTFNPTNLMNLVQKNLKSSRVVNAGPHGGKMVCGYNTSNNSVASECVWATTTTFGIVEYFNARAAREGHQRVRARPQGEGRSGGPRPIDSPLVSRPGPIELPSQYAPAEVEGPRYERWEKAGYFTADATLRRARVLPSSSRRRTSPVPCTSATPSTTR